MYSVLLVDDEPRAIEGLQLFVNWREHGFQICGVCENGEEALATAARLSPDVVVTDIRMPEMDGLELIGLLQASQAHAPEFIVISGFSEFAYAKRAMHLGVQHYLLKPIMEEEACEVLDRVRERLERRKDSGNLPTNQASAAEWQLPMEVVHLIRRILEAVESMDGEEADRQIKRLTEDFENDSEAWFGVLASHLNVQYAKLIQGMGGDPAELLQFRGDAEARQATPEHVREYASRAIDAVRTLRDRQACGMLHEVDRFIRAQYRNSLTIKQVAAQFFVNPVYLGKAYLDKFGCSLLDRIHDLRIGEAQRLLRETDLGTAKIAEQVGYPHYHHFLLHFEKRTGMKPSAFRSHAP